MSDLIDRQMAIDALDTGLWGVKWDKALATAMLKDLPSADAVMVVRCKNCKHKTYCYSNVFMTNKTQSKSIYKHINFCSYGERRQDG